MSRESGRLARFVAHTSDNPQEVMRLADDHPAVVEGRTLFPNTVVNPFESRRFLVSGENSSKIGKLVEKGPWAGLPVYCLTLEERATCPRSCHMWNSCFGAGMPLARRNNALDADFIPALKAEVVTLVRETCAPNPFRPKDTPPKGLVIRLHVLGDFFSAAYVAMWRELMRFLPELRVYGYTARRADGTEEDAAIARALAENARLYPDRWVIRTSHVEPGPGRTIVLDRLDAVETYRDDVIVCPVEEGKSETCGTCALCWSPAAADKTIAFVLHGPKQRRPKKPVGNHRRGPSGPYVQRDELGLTPAEREVLEWMRGQADEKGLLRAGATDICEGSGCSRGNWTYMMKPLLASRCLQVVQKGRGPGQPTWWRLFAEPQAEFPPAPPVPLPTKKPRAPRHVGYEKPVSVKAAPLAPRKPDEPLVKRAPVHKGQPVKAKYHARTGTLLNPSAIGSAERLAIGTPEERVAALPETELERIARMYGAVVKKVAAE